MAKRGFRPGHKPGHRPAQAPGGKPRFWGRHAVSAALANPERMVRKLWLTHDAAAQLDIPADLPVTYADVADLGRLVPPDAPHQGMVADVEPLEDVWLGDLLAQGGHLQLEHDVAQLFDRADSRSLSPVANEADGLVTPWAHHEVQRVLEHGRVAMVVLGRHQDVRDSSTHLLCPGDDLRILGLLHRGRHRGL